MSRQLRSNLIQCATIRGRIHAKPRALGVAQQPCDLSNHEGRHRRGSWAAGRIATAGKRLTSYVCALNPRLGSSHPYAFMHAARLHRRWRNVRIICTHQLVSTVDRHCRVAHQQAERASHRRANDSAMCWTQTFICGGNRATSSALLLSAHGRNTTRHSTPSCRQRSTAYLCGATSTMDGVVRGARRLRGRRAAAPHNARGVR